ncbi:MAG: radical SAM protein, partial [Nitrosopumilus sp.]|nr:radical SAM protein [Nitrosopumilus sp.]
IRAKFPIFKDSENNQLLTAHINTSHACPFSCHFCSESSKVVGQLLSFDNKKELYKSLILENLSYGAESFFFDDSVLCAGDIKKIHTLLDSFIELKNLSSSNTSKLNQGIKNRLNKLQWGAQFTVDFLVIIHDAQTIKQLLIKMKKAGCNYIYIGLESLSTQVIDKVQKNLQRKGDWLNKVRQALTMLHDAEIRVGTSLLFGLPGETMDSINETIDRVSNFINQNLIYIASPNIVTYHPNTELSIIDGVAGSLNYFKLPNKVSPPYSFFEEAFSEWVPKRITEQMIWQIHNKTNSLWKEGRNNNLMNPSLEN